MLNRLFAGVALSGCFLNFAGCGMPAGSLPADSIAAQAKHTTDAGTSRTVIFFTDGSSVEFPAGARLERRHSSRHGDLIAVRAKRLMAGYHADKVLSILDSRTGGRLVSETQPADGGGGVGNIGNCGADRQTCPPCDLCSGPVPSGQPAGADCIDFCGFDLYGLLYGRIRIRTVDPENLTCVFDLSTGETNCDFDATNTGGGPDPVNHLVHYVRISASPGYNYSMECSPFPTDGFASGTFTDSRGSAILFPGKFSGGQSTTFVVPSPDAANTKMNENFYRFPIAYQGYCRGSN
jgi:hypothetical protein